MIKNNLQLKSGFRFTFRFSISLLTLLTISSCNSFYQNEYLYIPPTDIDARACILACRQAKDSCDSDANKAYQECLREADSSSMLNYSINLDNKQTSVTTKDMYTLEKCRVYSKACENAYNDCYVKCGGKVEANQYASAQ